MLSCCSDAVVLMLQCCCTADAVVVLVLDSAAVGTHPESSFFLSWWLIKIAVAICDVHVRNTHVLVYLIVDQIAINCVC